MYNFFLLGTPPPPTRETPLSFAHPHVSVRFGIGGHLVTVLPVKPSSHFPAVVDIHSVQVGLLNYIYMYMYMYAVYCVCTCIYVCFVHAYCTCTCIYMYIPLVFHRI